LLEYICNTSPLQYLHQLGRMDILPALTGRLIVPIQVVAELEAGRALGCDVPDICGFPWVATRSPVSAPALPLAADLGRGEAAVLALALESKDAVVILDDNVGRRAAELLGIRLTGTLGLLLDAKKKGLIFKIAPVLDELDRLRFRVSPATRAAVLKLAGEK
jgi:predicted nucleic acid-binding protein